MATELVDETAADVVFVCGEVRSRTDVVSALPERVAVRVCEFHAGARGHRVREDEIGDMIDAEFERRRREAIAGIAERFRSEKGRRSGLAAEGLAPVCAALRDGDVDTLIVAELGDATVVTGENRTTVAPDADVLSELGEAANRVVRADEALPFAAIATGASLEEWMTVLLPPMGSPRCCATCRQTSSPRPVARRATRSRHSRQLPRRHAITVPEASMAHDQR
jgi:hypothetical protein